MLASVTRLCSLSLNITPIMCNSFSSWRNISMYFSPRQSFLSTFAAPAAFERVTFILMCLAEPRRAAPGSQGGAGSSAGIGNVPAGNSRGGSHHSPQKSTLGAAHAVSEMLFIPFISRVSFCHSSSWSWQGRGCALGGSHPIWSGVTSPKSGPCCPQSPTPALQSIRASIHSP